MNVKRLGGIVNATDLDEFNKTNTCLPNHQAHAAILFTIAVAGITANLTLMTAIIIYKPLRRWSHGLLFHQGIVDSARAALLIPLGISVLECRSLPQCALIGTAFILLVTVSTVNMLTSVLNDAPVTAETVNNGQSSSNETRLPVLLDSPQCVLFGMFMIWFASFTINLGPTFLSGALASWTEPMDTDKCPLITDSLQHYVLSVLWIFINALCITLTGFHLRKLHRDLTKSNLEAVRIASLVTTMISVQSDTDNCEHQQIRNYIQRMEREGLQRVRMFVTIVIAYILFWSPLSAVIIVEPLLDYPPLTYQVAIHIAFVHSFVNPALLLTLHRGMRQAVKYMLCCGCCSGTSNTYNNVPGYRNYSCSINRSYM
ncbi:Uncharacterised protein r2_g693 [Pycnogonum litorale]